MFETKRSHPRIPRGFSLVLSLAWLVLVSGCGGDNDAAKNSDQQNAKPKTDGTVAEPKSDGVVNEPAVSPPANQADSRPITDIWTGVSVGNKQAVEKFLDTGTDVNATFHLPGVPGSGGTPLHIAAIAGEKEIAELLIARGANIEAKAKDEFGGTPLHWSAFFGKPQIAAVLIAAGANVNAKDKNGFTPLDATSGQTGAGKMKVAELLKKADASSTVAAAGGEPSIWILVSTGDVAAVKKHIASGADLDAPEPQGGSTLLLLAAFAGKLEVTKLLIEHDADVNARNNEGSTALSSSTFACHTEIVQLLVDSGADVALKDKRGLTAFDGVKDPWSDDTAKLYKEIGALLNVQFDLERIKTERPKVQAILKAAVEKSNVTEKSKK